MSRMRGWMPWSSWSCMALACLVLAARPAPGSAQPRPDSLHADEDRAGEATDSTDAVEGQFVEQPQRGPWWTLWSWRAPHDRIIAGMITTHLYELDQAPTNNRAIGLIYGGFFGATFITTHGPRGWVAGFERAWLEGRFGPFQTMLGFRAGLVYGYDDRLFKPAAWTPILPYGQPVLLARAGPVSLDFTYTWVVVSLTAGLTLW